MRRVRDVAVDVGWREALWIAPQWLVCRRYLGLVADLRDLALERAPHPEIRVTALDAADVAAVSALDSALTPDEVMRRLEEGQRCTLGCWGRHLAHARWDSTTPVYLPYLGRVIRPGPGDQVVVGIHTAPGFRGRGIAGAVMVDVTRHARAVGVSRLVWLSAWWNRRSLALAEQFSSRVVGTVGYWALGPHRRYFASGRLWIEPDGSIGLDVTPPGSRCPDRPSFWPSPLAPTRKR